MTQVRSAANATTSWRNRPHKNSAIIAARMVKIRSWEPVMEIAFLLGLPCKSQNKAVDSKARLKGGARQKPPKLFQAWPARKVQ
jgi:hypothetical protein